MNYIYDIVVNFNTYAFDFYDWNDSDRLTHIRKIPVFKIDPTTLNKIIENNVKFEDAFLEQIKDKTEIFTNKNVKIIGYSFLLCDGMTALALKIDKNRLYKSRLLLEEEEEVLDICGRFKEEKINILVYKKNNIENFMTRKQMNLIKQVDKMLTETYKNKDYDTLKYIYYDCFNEKNEDVENIMTKLKSQIRKQNDGFLMSICNFYKILEIKK